MLVLLRAVSSLRGTAMAVTGRNLIGDGSVVDVAAALQRT